MTPDYEPTPHYPYIFRAQHLELTPEIMKAIRQKYKLTQRQMALEMGYAIRMYRLCERGQKRMERRFIMAFRGVVSMLQARNQVTYKVSNSVSVPIL